MKVSDALMAELRAHTDHLFLLPGGGANHLVDSAGRYFGPNAIALLHEQAAGFAALAYAQARGFAAVLVTSGPGATNAITACAAAWADSVPVLFISGQARREYMGLSGRMPGSQMVHIKPMVEGITKSCRTIYRPEAAHLYLVIYCRLAQAERPGPVWMDIPQDVQAAQV